ncbi:hypothetical protein TrRE_jg8572 [Triparma retinervis]|uniref:Uncharacterized protein n=1 Tax=Triparma retinervis TaxID=2557542 RepID=A0A9W7FHF3_9STRA|nr:hypothetical protein TrRE_jg8572 [Triparma retinervis]
MLGVEGPLCGRSLPGWKGDLRSSIASLESTIISSSTEISKLETLRGNLQDRVLELKGDVEECKRNPKLNVGGWLYVDENLTNVEQVLEGPRSSVERLFYGRKVTDERGNLKGKESWVGGIYGDPAHSVKKAFQQEAAGSGGVRVYQHWGMSWAITTVTDDSNGGASRRLAKIVAKQPEVKIAQSCTAKLEGKQAARISKQREQARQVYKVD